MEGKAKVVMSVAGAFAVTAAILNGAAILSNAGAHPGGAGTTATPAPTPTPAGPQTGPRTGPQTGPLNGAPPEPVQVQPGTTRTVKIYCQATVPPSASQACPHITHVQVLVDAVNVSTDLLGDAGSADADTAKTIAGAAAGWAAANVHTTPGTGGKVSVHSATGQDLADAGFGA